ncbi:NAD(P)-dependent dehydrogenase, short-chain alcohol dehydrogenase family [Streptomyces zhaozhouensis]|uniref:NAD(P)-dependent dehydrogenase, short-chain alcohol dehydrogenase family n=1 Tax=Streptomyces zhaozhouensis TaxID=1300267 RepID=A0A286DQ39_9ACTN|nr:SDR family NAD(P)-dependent oxidoreductase [Streptomyces zhaozhouensis]SOD60769.1 NAD(P)-dependent dehydrogenase, short-chain alcohol dehydrogenase family [Streptomyces zhaozhouensis]
MSEKQRPLGSGFTPASTAREVLAGVDLAGRNVVITGGHAGIGLAVTTALVEAGASVTSVSRDPDRAARALAGLGGSLGDAPGTVATDRLDLLDPASVDAFTGRWLATGRPLHILVNGAGAPGPPERTVDARGYEVQFATNHLGHFQLTRGLLPALRAARGARVVNVTSGAQRLTGIRWDDPHFTTGYEAHLAYAQSKTANVLFTVELDRRWAPHGIRGYAPHPGIVVGTALNGAAGEESLRAMGLIDAEGRPIIDPARERKTPEQGAATIVFAAASPLLAGVGGVYLRNSDISELDDEDRPFDPVEPVSTVMSRSLDPESAQRLWALSEQLTAA